LQEVVPDYKDKLVAKQLMAVEDIFADIASAM